ncbi:ABC transporter permease [Pseudoalteromonas sp. MSK9-3]|uniref:ABC transporter permease n=1 Tax=Pseudoalteromonas sp. MSK9-3 TaxID=1897633 RepID=UPI000E6B5465|nr:ABC transporter permease [Pseudoalteromonas sp. MSK9-3]RJE77196.1 ABC transporter permease [Pseudoalteromonas sp. MSK9-3]
MIFNYFKTALRSIKQDTQHFMLNLLGFSIGLAAAIMVALFAAYELSYDSQHPNADRVYRVHTDYRPWGLQMIAASDSDLALEMLSHTQVEDALILTDAHSLSYFAEPMILDVTIKGETARLSNVLVASSNLLDFINLEVLFGDLNKALTRPGQLAISQAESIRLFGNENSVGQTLSYEQGRYEIAAVFADLPDNTHFVFDTLAAIPTVLNSPIRGYVYLRLAEDADPDLIVADMVENMREKSTGRHKQLGLTLNKLQDLHFNSSGPFEMKQGGSSLVMQVCIALTVLLLLIASVNFINLNIAGAAKRAKEVGVRKALGASKPQLISQFLTESMFVVMIAALIALVLVELMIPSANQLLERSLSLSFSPLFLVLVAVVVILIGLLSGLYPALFISSFSAKRVLSGDLQRGKTAIWVRKLTLGLQGGLSVALIVAAIVVYKQMALIGDLPVGYSKTDRVIIKNLPTEAIYQANDNRLMSQLKALDGVEQVTQSNTLLTHDMTSELFLVWPNGERLRGTQPSISTGFHAAETLGFELVAGRDFSPQYASDWMATDEQGISSFSVLLSESLAKQAGYANPAELVGQTLATQSGRGKAKVVGIIKDVKIGSARQQQLPVSVNVASAQDPLASIVIKVSPGTNKARIMQAAQRIVIRELAITEVDISLIEDDYKRAHINEHRMQQLVVIFSGLAVILTCMGILGLASFATIRRQKEVAVRKVLGASRISIVNLLSKEFLAIVGIGGLIAIPLVYWLMGDWLNNFNERTDQAIWIYGVATLSVVAITWLTVASLAFKAANTRPSLILRYE